MNRDQLIHDRVIPENEPLPDAFGYKYKDTSIRTVKHILDSTVSESKKSPVSAATLIINECKDSCSEAFLHEGFMKNLKDSVSYGVMNLVRGSLMNGFNVDMDKDAFHRVLSKDDVNTRSPEFKNAEKVYLALVKKEDSSCLVLLHNGKIVYVAGNGIDKGKETCGSIMKKAETVWWTKSQKKNEGLVSLSKAQKILIG